MLLLRKKCYYATIFSDMAMYKPTPRECAALLLRALEERGERRGKPLTRARLSRLTLTNLWNRQQLDEAWLREVNDWLLSAGWVLIATGAIYGVVKTAVIENWPRVASKHIREDLNKVSRGSFDFSKLERLLQAANRTTGMTATSAKRKGSRKSSESRT
jgi:hypothetical protein